MKSLNRTLASCLIGAVFLSGCSQPEGRYSGAEINEVSNVDRAYKQVANQDLKPGKNAVSYDSEGAKIAAYLYLPDDYVGGEKRPAIVINPPATGVKEQTIGLYAEKLSQKGFITLAFDPRGFGESEGHPLLQDPYRIIEDIYNSISFLRTLEAVDVENVFSMGMCAGAGYASHAAAFDSRVKAVAMVSPYLTSASDYLQLMGSPTNLRANLMPQGAAARQKYFETGEDTMIKMVPETAEEAKTARPIGVGMMEYYLPGKPGDVPNWRNALSLTSMNSVLSFSAYNFTHLFDTVPVYMVYGDQAITADGATKFYDAINGPKEKLVAEGAGHFDLYWRPEYVDPAVEGISNFMKSHI
ncbi:MAG: alpha/beta hydrolase [Leptolyngbyaceae cyanobacterium MO_188.B28]|nr:alpha/beta hydrolase [Leptolyngbyaceae cyanobacterium MO_188.B28]